MDSVYIQKITLIHASYLPQTVFAMTYQTHSPRSSNELEIKLIRSFSHLQFVAQCFGAAPLDLTFWRVLQMGLTIAYLLAVTAQMYFQRDELKYVQDGFEQFLFICRYSVTIFICGIVCLGCQLQRPIRLQFVRRIVDLQLKLEACSSPSDSPFNELKTFLDRMLAGFAVFLICIFFVDIFSNDFLPMTLLRTTLILILPSVISSLALMQFVALLHILRSEYAKLNSVIQASLSHLMEWRKRQQYPVYKVTPLLARPAKFDAYNPNNLNVARHLHIELGELYEEGTATVGYLMICVFVQTVLQNIIQLYLLYRFAVNLEPIDSWRISYSAIWMVLHLGQLFVVLLYSDLLNKEVGGFNLKSYRQTYKSK